MWWCCCQAKGISKALLTVPHIAGKQARQTQSHWLWLSMGLYVFNDWPVQWKSAETIFLCHLRVDTEAVGLELGQFDRVIQHCAILADGLISTSVGTTFPVIESSNDTFPSSMLLIYNNICFNLLLNLYIYRKMSQNFTLLLGLQRFSKSCVCTCRAASWTCWLPHLISVKEVFC